MATGFLACTALGVPILTFGNFDEIEWLKIAKLTATIGGMQEMEGFRFNSHDREFCVKPFLTSYHKFYCVVMSDDDNPDSQLIAYTIGHGVDVLLHECMASVLAYLSKKADEEEKNSTFANRAESEITAMEDCLNVLFTTTTEKDMIISFEQHFIPRVLLPDENGKSTVCNWFAPFRECLILTDLCLLEWAADGDDVSDFIAAAGQCTFTTNALYSERVMPSTGTVEASLSRSRSRTANSSTAELLSAYLQNYVAGVAGSPERQRIMAAPDANARVVCLGDGTSVWMSVVSPKLVLFVRAVTSGVAAVGGVVRCTVRLAEAYPDNLRNAFQKCANQLALTFPALNPDCPIVPGEEIFNEMLGVRGETI